MAGLAVTPEAARALQNEAARKVFRVQVAMGVIGNEDFMKLADRVTASNDEGVKKANQLRNRALSVLQTYLDEAD
ncbi:MAG: hypothetical protein KGL39_12890 [Patescibacteria group bacterium]|nr:hypothetical protein [Patescibacteria group bacterium]